MLVFGLAGMLMAGVVALALVLGAFAARNLDDRLAADQAKISASLTRLTVTMESLATTTQNAGTTLETSSQTLIDARNVLATTSDTLVSVADALNVTILGNRPFATASEKLASLARTISTFEGKAETLALNLHQNATDVGVMTDQIRLLKSQINELASAITGFDRIGEMVALLVGGIVLGALLTGWVAVGAGFCAWVGWRLRRIGASNGPSRADGASAAR